MEAYLLFGVIAALAAFGCLFAGTYAGAASFASKRAAMVAQGEPAGLSGLVRWRLRNGFAVLLPLSRFVFIGLWIRCLGICQQAWLFSHLRVKQNTRANLIALILSNVAGIAMAWHGWAFWGLAAQSVLYTAIGTSLRWFASPWRPSWHIDLRPAWHMFGFSSKLLVNSLAYQLNNRGLL